MDATQLRSKLIGSEDERAVSPVIGVILMVAITVILAAVIAAFVLDLGQSQTASPSAGFEFSEDGSGIQITLIQEDRVDDSPGYQINGQTPSNYCSSGDLSSVGSVCENSSWSSGTTITITATYEGNRGVVAQYDG